MLRNFVQRCLSPNFIAKRYAGHSKWANIRHIKGAKDAERNLLFTKLSRQIKVAVQEGGSFDPKSNLKLYQILEQCKRSNMPTATMQSVLKSCQADKSNSKLHMFEIKGPGNCIILCEVFAPSSRVIIKQQMSTILKKHQSKHSDGGGSHLFEERGIIQAEPKAQTGKSADELLELATEHAIESNAEEVSLIEDNVLEFLCSKSGFPNTLKSLEEQGYNILNASVDYIPINVVSLESEELKLYETLIKKLEEVPEVVRIFDNVSSQ